MCDRATCKDRAYCASRSRGTTVMWRKIKAKFREQCRYILSAIPWVTRATTTDGDNHRKPAPV